MTYTLSMFNTGQVTLPKAWREKFNTKLFIAKETENGLVIQPLETEGDSDEQFYHLADKSFGFWNNPKDDEYQKFYTAKK